MGVIYYVLVVNMKHNEISTKPMLSIHIET